MKTHNLSVPAAYSGAGDILARAGQVRDYLYNLISSLSYPTVILHAAKNEAGSNVWKLWVIKDSKASR